jgi:hypothetical protein
LALAGVVFGTIKGGETVVNLYRNHKLSKSRDEAATVLMKRALPPSDSAVASLLREMALGLPEKLDDKAYKKAHKVLKNKLGHFGTQLREEKVGAAVAAVEGEARPQNPMYEHAR